MANASATQSHAASTQSWVASTQSHVAAIQSRVAPTSTGRKGRVCILYSPEGSGNAAISQEAPQIMPSLQDGHRHVKNIGTQKNPNSSLPCMPDADNGGKGNGCVADVGLQTSFTDPKVT